MTAGATATAAIPERGSKHSAAGAAQGRIGARAPGLAKAYPGAGSPRRAVAVAAPAPVARPAAIYSVAATPTTVHGGDAVVWDVRTTPDVVNVSAHVAAITLPLHRTAPGRFALVFRVPQGVPFFFHGVYTLDVRALTATGETLHRSVSLTFS